MVAKRAEPDEDGLQRYRRNQEVIQQTQISAEQSFLVAAKKLNSFPEEARVKAYEKLEEEVSAGRFREDLFYRLNVVRIHISPLRERREDVRILAEFFLQRMAARKRMPQMRFSEDALALLEAYDWPGNVRELENTLQRAAALCNTDVLLPTDIPLGSNTQRTTTWSPSGVGSGVTDPQVRQNERCCPGEDS